VLDPIVAIRQRFFLEPEQSVSVDIVTGVIKANLPARLSYRVNTKIDKGSSQITGDFTDDRHLDGAAWDLYINNANRLGRMMKEDYGLKMVLHPHGDSHIETREDIDRIFQATDPEYVGFCLDTGHIVYGMADNIALIKDYPERISYVHIKAMDPKLVKQAHDEDWPFVKAVHAGCSVAPPEGEPDMPTLIEALADLDKELYVICEQDMYGCDPAYPAPNAAKVREYLASIGLGLA